MAEYFGWWDYESSPPALLNRFTGERIVCQKFLAGTPLPKYALGFVYSDGDSEFPIVVRTSLQGRGPYRGRPYLQSTWEIDYDLSAEIWRGMTGGSDRYPAYHAWARMDDCVVDALSCWPEHDPRISTHSLVSRGGWFGGKWLSTQKREHSAHARLERGRQEIATGYPLGHVQLGISTVIEMPIWRFIDADIATNRVTLDHLELERGFPYLPTGELLSGFDKVPHLRRNDGGAVYFPSEILTHFHRGEDCYLDAHFVYADHDAVLGLTESDLGETASFAPWLCSPRDPTQMAGYDPFERGQISRNLRPVLYPYWRRAWRILSEVRFLWQGPERQMSVTVERWEQDRRVYRSHASPRPPRFKFRPRKKFSLHGGFVAGIPWPRWSVSISPYG